MNNKGCMDTKDNNKRKDCLKKRRAQFMCGNFTIETSFVLLVILFVVIFIIYLSVFLYGKVVFTNTAYVGAFRGTQKLSEGTDRAYDVMKRTSDEKIQFPSWVFDECNEKIDINARNVSVYYSVGSDMRLLDMISLLGDKKWSMEISGTAKYSNGVTFIRNCRRIERINEGREENDNP